MGYAFSMGKRPFAHAIGNHFLAWQCRIRQVAMREDGGSPSAGMRPRVLDVSGREMSPALTVLMIPKEPEESTAFFRHQVMRTPDPRDVYERALAFLQADYFQVPDAFGERLASVLSPGAALASALLDDGKCVLAFAGGPRNKPDRQRPGAALASALLDDGKCVLAFEQGRQRYSIPCKVRELKQGSAAREAAIWHNRLFNPALPDTVHVFGFHPDWNSATADPWPDGRKSRSP